MSRLVRRLLGERVYIKFKPLGHYPDYLWWVLRGKPVRSPHLLKQRTVAECGRRYKLRCLVETGTYYGEMVAALCRQFDRVYSIEFDPKLAEYSRERFKNDPQVKILEGDSRLLVPHVVAELDRPAVFWLDAGYYGVDLATGDLSRLLTELRAILSSPIKEHVVLMDDARMFVGTDSKFSAAQLVAWIEREYPDRKVEIVRDIFRVTHR
ncbi:MAG: hypothetical protein WBQ43_22245 [Terriglobales bacterium]